MMLIAGASLLAPYLHLPETFLRTTGFVLIPWVALTAWLSSRESLPRSMVWGVILGNAAWTIASLAVLTTPWLAPSTLGVAFIVAQAAAVGIFAELQYLGLRKSGPELALR